MTDSPNPKDIISSFVEERFSGDIDGLKYYCFAALKEYPDRRVYGRCSGSSSFDCDNTRLANAIYVLLWGGDGNIFPGLTMENVGSGKDFRGDTMNSFRWVLGSNKDLTVSRDIESWVKENAAYPKDKKGLSKTISHWDRYGMGEKAAIFYRTYHTVGNFVVLPNRYAGDTTLNFYRGENQWHDFFDRFLIELDKVFSGSDEKDVKLNYLAECNRSAFEGKTLPGLADALFLNDYMDGRKPKALFAPYSTGKWHKDIDNEEYRVFAMRYIDTATKIISHRADKMCKRLSELL